ncbi:hypothetical protein RHSIM_RhsimUnG0058500 [Rhododendron simsii]|uniref:DRBM domain-containing protein n=1 Tax=Rhododendron simsii TaxID=118357 RepID=A0A834L4U5_RHOSS|nr:hypothetical protein RHSIM_RhsimUnG0058500 [Rhododendron simsii]
MYKNQLQELAQRSCFNLPSYTCIREGPDHAPRFKSIVNFNGDTFESPNCCSARPSTPTPRSHSTPSPTAAPLSLAARILLGFSSLLGGPAAKHTQNQTQCRLIHQLPTGSRHAPLAAICSREPHLKLPWLLEEAGSSLIRHTGLGCRGAWGPGGKNRLPTARKPLGSHKQARGELCLELCKGHNEAYEEELLDYEEEDEKAPDSINNKPSGESAKKGAMENKSLNIFNSKLVLPSPETATDADYAAILGVIGHEYFRNWTGYRVTCRDWFQLSLKEFSSDMGSSMVKRIADVLRLRNYQFPQCKFCGREGTVLMVTGHGRPLTHTLTRDTNLPSLGFASAFSPVCSPHVKTSAYSLLVRADVVPQPPPSHLFESSTPDTRLPSIVQASNIAIPSSSG